MKPLRDALLNDEPGARAAHLALVEPDRVDDALDRRLHVRVVEDDEGRFSSELQRELLALARRGLPDEPADIGGAGEGDLVHAGVFDEKRARLALALHDVDHALRQARLHAQFREGDGRQRRLFRRLEDHGAAGRKRRRDLPRQHQQREVPRNDLAADAGRRHAGKLALDQLRPAGVVVEVARDEGDVDVARLADRLAVVDGFEHRQEARMLLHLARQRVEEGRALVPGPVRPALERRARRRDGLVDRLLAGGRQAGDRLAGRRLDDVEAPLAVLSGEGAVDEMPELFRAAGKPVADDPVVFWRGTVAHVFKDLCDDVHRNLRSA